MNYEIDDEILDHDLPNPRWRRFWVGLFAVVMLTAMLGGAIFPAWSLVPSILGYWKNSYDVRLTDIQSGNCDHSANVVYQTASSLYCICGVVDADDSTADFYIHLQDASRKTLGTLSLYGQASGGFCRALQLDDILGTGRYSLIVKPRLARSEISRTYFEIENNRPGSNL